MRGGQTPNSVKADKLKYAMLVAPDVDVDVFRMQIQRMGAARPRIALFVSQDDEALSLSGKIWVVWAGWAMSIPHRSHIGVNSSGTRYWSLI